MSSGQKPEKAWEDGTSPITKYILDHSLRLTPTQEKLIEVTKTHKKAGMLSSADELQLLQNIVRMMNAKKTLDIGVFTGYSALTIALALPDDGKVVALDVSEEFTAVGKPFWKEAGVENKIDLRIAPALDSLEALVESGESGSFDFAFIDADKPNYKNYYEYSLKLLRPNGVIVVDNVLWDGKVATDTDTSESTVAMRAFNKAVAADDRVHISMINIGDGITIAIKK